MTEKPIVPANVNPLYSDKFKFIINEARNVEFFCFRANIPGLSLTPLQIDTPVNPHYVGGKKLYYQDLELSFRVNEDLANYKEIFNWMIGITGPQSTDQFKNFNAKRQNVSSTKYNVWSDGTLFSLTNSSNPNIIINFKNLMPISLSGLEMDTTNYQTVVASVGFKFDWYEFG
jgi:hypothetical protein